MQVHVAAAVWVRWPSPQRTYGGAVPARATADLSRRSLVRAGGLVLGTAAAYAALDGAAAALALPGATRRATGSYEVSSLVAAGACR